MNAKLPLAVGIDLGTTYSVVAYLDAAGRPITIANAEGDLTHAQRGAVRRTSSRRRQGGGQGRRP